MKEINDRFGQLDPKRFPLSYALEYYWEDEFPHWIREWSSNAARAA